MSGLYTQPDDRSHLADEDAEPCLECDGDGCQWCDYTGRAHWLPRPPTAQDTIQEKP